ARWTRPCRWPMRLEPLHSSVLTVVPSRHALSTTSSSSTMLAVSMTSSRTSSDSRPTTPAIGGRSVSKVPWPRRLWARRRGGSSGSSCGTPSFPRILIHLVGLDHGVAQRVAAQADAGALLEPVPQAQQLLAIAAQLAGHLRRGGALSDPAEDHQELRGAAMG